MEKFERTLVVIKPEAMKHKDVIVRRIMDAGFTILQSRIVRLTPEQASEFYRTKKTHPSYHAWIVALTEGPIQAMCVSKSHAVSDLLWLIGPERYQDAIQKAPGSLRAMFADSRDEVRNAIHGSEGTSSAQFEINFFFPSLLLEPIFDDQNLNNYLSAMVNPVLMQGLYIMAKERPEDPVVWFSNWLLSNNPYKPKVTSSTSEPLYGIIQETKFEVPIPKDDHVGAQSHCDCNEYTNNGICSCSLSIIAEIE